LFLNKEAWDTTDNTILSLVCPPLVIDEEVRMEKPKNQYCLFSYPSYFRETEVPFKLLEVTKYLGESSDWTPFVCRGP
jgi:hypothetical protein